ncbi:MAG TPA: biopolymer transporter ExbD [bacterium]|nr:biopolymer transporter ExbD [bacterium]
MNYVPPRSLADINVTNLVDVTLVLLVIFMIASPLIQMGVQVDLPKATTNQIETRGNLTVTIRKDATIYVEDQLVPLSALASELKQAIREGKNGVLVRADKEVSYGAVIKVLDVARKSGVGNVGLVTELGEEAKRR